MELKLTMYAIGNEDNDSWFNAEAGGWVDESDLEGECLFPTFYVAHNYMEENVDDESAKIYKVMILTSQSYEYEPVHLPNVTSQEKLDRIEKGAFIKKQIFILLELLFCVSLIVLIAFVSPYLAMFIIDLLDSWLKWLEEIFNR
ncbi:hypothetical protein [Evansella clarkii]|uniref:hypothetical protein n=1 Tax=Evansella clarkii TaxID=79879 RepID=UPI0009967F33|nr:hypothetical protein [Evansella clarkii]